MAKTTGKKTAKTTGKTSVKIDSKMSIGDVVNNFPETMEVFLKHGLHCIGCAAAQFENIEQGAMAHGINIKKLVDDLNKTVSKKKK